MLNNQRVYSRPIEKMLLSIIEPTSSIILDGVAMVITSANENNINVQIKPDTLESSSEKVKYYL